MIVQQDDEYLDLVNAEDQVIGKKLRSQIYAEGLLNFRVINAFLVNSQGQLWIPRRSLDKRLFPGCLDMSVGGHVESGETYNQAFKRELAEELNIDADQIAWKVIGRLNPLVDRTSVFMHVYEMSSDITPQYNPNDFTESSWLTPQELLHRIESGDPSKSDLPLLIQKFYM
ncbi:MAG: NUDIX hydrolase [Chlamydiota bacterium]